MDIKNINTSATDYLGGMSTLFEWDPWQSCEAWVQHYRCGYSQEAFQAYWDKNGELVESLLPI